MSLKTLKKSQFGFKILRDSSDNYYLCELEIPKGSEVYHEPLSYKSRASQVLVLRIVKLKECWAYYYFLVGSVHDVLYLENRNRKIVHHKSDVGRPLIYKVGHLIKPDKFSKDNNDCDHGIHYYSWDIFKKHIKYVG